MRAILLCEQFTTLTNCPTRAKLFQERRTNKSKLVKNTEVRNFIIETWKVTALYTQTKKTDVRYFKDFPVFTEARDESYKNEPPAKLDSIIYNFHIYTATKEKENNMMNRIHMVSIGLLASKHPVLLGEQNEREEMPSVFNIKEFIYRRSETNLPESPSFLTVRR